MIKSVSTFISMITVVSLAFMLLPLAVGADGSNRTALTVIHGDARTVSVCISFDENEISSFDALQRSGMTVRFSGFGGLGAAVCAIDGQGCPREDQQCFCQCLGTPCLFWSFWLWRDGQWTYSQRGASNVPVHHGDLQAWFWSDGQTPPPAVSFEQVCPPPPTQTPLPSDTPRPTDTTVPTETPVATQVPADTQAPTVASTNQVFPTEPPTLAATPAGETAASAVPSHTKPSKMTPSPMPTSTAMTTLRPASPTVAPAPSQTMAPAATLTSTAATTPQSKLTATPVPPPIAAPTPSAPQSAAPLAQYGAFALLAAALLGGFWLLRRRQGAL